jgi:aryl sulfotransferase
MNQPSRSTNYKGPITDTSRWENFQHRSDDIFVCTPPKCGTTWTQAICAMLVFGKVDHGEKPGSISPWIDSDFAPIDEYLQMVEAQSHRRYIKTHSPFDGIPYYPECSYLVVCRDPRDMYCSMLNHRDNMAEEELAQLVMPSGDDAFNQWLNGTFKPDDFDIQCLEGACHFLKTYWPYRDLPNVQLAHYFDMKNDLRSHVAKVANYLTIEVNDQLLDEITVAATFESMQARGNQYAPMAGENFWKSENGFFATGTNAQWKEKLTTEQVEAFDDKIKEFLSAEQIEWIVRS